MNFKIWLEQDHDYDSEQDQLEHKIFQFVFDKIQKAYNIAVDGSVKLYDAMAKVWPQNERGRDFFLPKESFPNHYQIRFRIEPFASESETIKNNGVVNTISIGVKELQESLLNKDTKSSQNHLERIAGSLNHEITHLHHKGADGGDGGVEDVIRYMTNAGEMRAHAKDYAYTWNKVFPNQPFDANKFIQNIIPRLVQSKQKKANNYFVAFADPSKQEKYKNIADIKSAREQLVSMINGYVNYYNKSQSKSQNSEKFNGFQPNDQRNWQQRQQYLNSIGIDTTGWLRQDIMRGFKNS